MTPQGGRHKIQYPPPAAVEFFAEYWRIPGERPKEEFSRVYTGDISIFD
jgi:hypothetical protein